MKYFVFYNSLADNRHGFENAEKIRTFISDDIEFCDITMTDIDFELKSIPSVTGIIIVGGDGTLNRFINSVDCDALDRDVYYFAGGSGNDFASDVAGEAKNKLILLNPYIKNLPKVKINDKTYKFLNGVGYGIDGYCCDVGDKIRNEYPDKKINYTSIAINGLLFHYKPKKVTIDVDGDVYEFKNCWLSPVMNGRMYGGGMIPTPAQVRIADPEKKKLSVMIMRGKFKLGVLFCFSKIFKGAHVKNKRRVAVFSGRRITVCFDSPATAQVDGETICNVSKIECEV